MKTVMFEDGTTIHVKDCVLATMLSYVQICSTQMEAGGIILGKKVVNREEYILTEITVPSSGDKRSRFSFVRNKKSAQNVINRKWKETDGVVNYLGEWHTHPENNPIPSEIDRALLRQIINDKSNAFPKVTLMIVGTHSIYLGLADSNISKEILYYQYI